LDQILYLNINNICKFSYSNVITSLVFIHKTCICSHINFVNNKLLIKTQILSIPKQRDNTCFIKRRSIKHLHSYIQLLSTQQENKVPFL